MDGWMDVYNGCVSSVTYIYTLVYDSPYVSNTSCYPPRVWPGVLQCRCV